MKVSNIYQHKSKEEKIQLYLKLLESIAYEEENKKDEKNSNLLSAKYRQKR